MMLQWSCFISYRLGKGKLSAGIINDFQEALSSELELQVDEGVYLSEGQLISGDVIDPSLEAALCRSACMVLVFTGKYFSQTHTYCAKEYLAMKRLERFRLQKSNLPAGGTHGLILPVVLRDLDQLPDELRKRMWCDFQEFQQDAGGITRPKAYFEQIRKLGKYIADRCRELRSAPGEVVDCNQFHFPDDGQVLHFLSELLPKPVGNTRRKKSKPTKSK